MQPELHSNATDTGAEQIQEREQTNARFKSASGHKSVLANHWTEDRRLTSGCLVLGNHNIRVLDIRVFKGLYDLPSGDYGHSSLRLLFLLACRWRRGELSENNLS